MPTELTMALAVKLASLIVHTDELTSPGGHPLDREAVRSGLSDPEVRAWLESFGPGLLPVKRGGRT